jgi:arsenate reductase (glutaredoxin)
VAYESRDFFKQPFTIEELRTLLKSLQLAAHEVVSTKSPAYKKLGLDRRTVTEDEMLALMVQESRLLRRPLSVVNGKPVIGFDKAKFKEMLT